MKKLALLLLLIIFHNSLDAQWEFQNPIPTNAEMNDIFFLDSIHGWAAGDYLTILYTNDGGITWSEQLSAEGEDFYQFSEFKSVYFVDLDHGWATGHWYMPYGGGYLGIIYRTTNGGESWEPVSGLYGYFCFCDVQFINETIGWAIDEQGMIIYTIDGGESFSVQFNDSTKILRSLLFTDSSNGWVSGDEGLILHTSNGGETWTEQTSNVNVNLSSIFFTDLLNGWAVGDMETYPRESKILHTEDGGNTWEVNYEGGSHQNMGKVFFSDEDHGWVTARPTFSGAWFLVTTDGGENWEYQFPAQQFYSIQSIYFINNNIGWATCDNNILSTSDGGEVWHPQNSISNYEFNDVCFTDNETGWIVGAEWDINEGSEWWRHLTLKTIDGGVNWSPVEVLEPGWPVSLESVFFSDSDHGWISGMGEDGCVFCRTVNGGLTWEVNEVCFRELYFIDSLNGWMSTGRYIYKTSDGGISWDDGYDIGEGSFIKSIFFVSESKGWAVGGRSNTGAIIFHTTDGGVSWQEQISESDWSSLRSVYFASEQQGWAIGFNTTILYTSDGGENWIQQQTESTITYLTSVYFVNENKGWIVGTESEYYRQSFGYVILYTENAGEDWVEQDGRPIGGLNAIQFIGDENGWAVGYGGMIMHTNNGGTVGYDERLSTYLDSMLISIYPNPFTTSTTLSYNIQQPSTVQISIFNHFGQQVGVIQQNQTQGKQQITWDASGQAAGIYIARIKTTEGTTSLKLVKTD